MILSIAMWLVIQRKGHGWVQPINFQGSALTYHPMIYSPNFHMPCASMMITESQVPPFLPHFSRSVSPTHRRKFTIESCHPDPSLPYVFHDNPIIKTSQKSWPIYLYPNVPKPSPCLKTRNQRTKYAGFHKSGYP